MREKGFWDKPRNKAEALCLMHSEISEMYEALVLNGNPPSEKCPGFLHAEEEAADYLLRLADVSHGFGYYLDKALEAIEPFDYSLVGFEDEFVADCHLMISRALEALRHENPDDPELVDRGITGIGGVEANLTRVLRLLEVYGELNNWRLWECVQMKHDFNKTRPRLHGKQF